MTISLDFLAVVLAVVIGLLLSGVVRWTWAKLVAIYDLLLAFGSDLAELGRERRRARLERKLAAYGGGRCRK